MPLSLYSSDGNFHNIFSFFIVQPFDLASNNIYSFVCLFCGKHSVAPILQLYPPGSG